MAKGQVSRKSKTSKGERRSSRGVQLTVLQLCLLNKGMAHPVAKSKKRKK